MTKQGEDLYHYNKQNNRKKSINCVGYKFILPFIKDFKEI